MNIDYATTATHGPFRRVVREEEQTGTVFRTSMLVEILECGHTGNARFVTKLTHLIPMRTKRRCLACAPRDGDV